MCGIVGALVFENGSFTITEPYIRKMRDTMVHRGPDGAGVWVSGDRRVGLGHRRLSIIDLSPSAGQPMGNEDGSLQVVFNGEIYNHAAIRAELEANRRTRLENRPFRHRSGPACVRRMGHRIAAAVPRHVCDCAVGWPAESALADPRSHRHQAAVLQRSPRPHDLRVRNQGPARRPAAGPWRQRDGALSLPVVHDHAGARDAIRTAFASCPAGPWLRVDARGGITEQRYWDAWDHVTPLEGVSEDEIAERILDELRTAVKLRKVSDVPVGVFLSGGIDSSTNARLFSEGEGSPVKTFSIGYEGEYKSYQNELHYARMVAKLVGADHHERLLTQNDLLDLLPTMVQLQDEPIADPVCVPVYYVSELARRNGVTVCQVGEGADELFWGYPTWKTKLRLERASSIPCPAAMKRLGLAGLRMAGKGQGHPYEALRRSSLGQPVFWGGADAFTDTQKHRLLSPRLRQQFKGLTSWDALAPIWQRFQDKAWEPSHLHWMSYVDLNVRLPELLLMRVDKMSMGVSLEGRVPFLDHKFVELALGIPSALKTRNGELKYRDMGEVLPEPDEKLVSRAGRASAEAFDS